MREWRDKSVIESCTCKNSLSSNERGRTNYGRLFLDIGSFYRETESDEWGISKARQMIHLIVFLSFFESNLGRVGIGMEDGPIL